MPLCRKGLRPPLPQRGRIPARRAPARVVFQLSFNIFDQLGIAEGQQLEQGHLLGHHQRKRLPHVGGVALPFNIASVEQKIVSHTSDPQTQPLPRSTDCQCRDTVVKFLYSRFWQIF